MAERLGVSLSIKFWGAGWSCHASLVGTMPTKDSSWSETQSRSNMIVMGQVSYSGIQLAFVYGLCWEGSVKKIYLSL